VERAGFWHCTFNRLHGQLRIGQFSATIILIMSTHLPTYGAWHGNWCWLKVVPALDADGHRVLGLDLPEHGDDRTATKDCHAYETGHGPGCRVDQNWKIKE
jgi:hypothetical protein